MEKNLTLIALFAALIAAMGLAPPIPTPFGVPITAQSMGVMMAGAVLGSWRGAAAALLFQLLVALGLPLLAGGRGGLSAFMAPTSGFLIGFPVAAFVTGLFVERVRLRPVALRAVLGAILGGVVVLYGFGAAGMSIALNKSFPEAFALVGAFIPGDLIKAVLTGVMAAALAKARPQSVEWAQDGGANGARW